MKNRQRKKGSFLDLFSSNLAKLELDLKGIEPSVICSVSDSVLKLKIFPRTVSELKIHAFPRISNEQVYNYKIYRVRRDDVFRKEEIIDSNGVCDLDDFENELKKWSFYDKVSGVGNIIPYIYNIEIKVSLIKNIN